MTITRIQIALIALALLVPVSIVGQQQEQYDYWKPQREMVASGQQAVFILIGILSCMVSL